MLHIFSGTHPTKPAEAAGKLIDSLLRKSPDAPLLRLDTEEVSVERLSEIAGSQGLFGDAAIVLLSRVLDDKEAAAALAAAAKELAQSPAVFIATGVADAKTTTALKKYADTFEVFVAPEKKEIEVNRFVLADALAARNKKELWIRYVEAIESGAVAEELHGILFWQVKTMLLAQHSKSAEEAGLKPFPYSKAKGALKNWKPGEVEKLSSDLVSIYHRAHRGEGELALLAERLILSI